MRTQQQITKDAVARSYKPEALVVTIDGKTVQVTSWPYLEGEGDDQRACIMARTVIGDATTNVEVPYFSLMKLVGTLPLDVAPSEADTTGEVFVLRDSEGEDWRVSWRGGLIAANWRQRGPADAHLQLLRDGVVKPQYARGCEPPPLFNRPSAGVRDAIKQYTDEHRND